MRNHSRIFFAMKPGWAAFDMSATSRSTLSSWSSWERESMPIMIGCSISLSSGSVNSVFFARPESPTDPPNPPRIWQTVSSTSPRQSSSDFDSTMMSSSGSHPNEATQSAGDAAPSVSMCMQ